jgi:DNA-binding SARP family transcriptional activator/tetratricopeptide (TPR) repeat protein
MEFGLFGEMRLRAGDQSLDVGTPRQQAVLAVLAIEAGRPIAIEKIIDRVWGDNPPAEARNVLYSHLSRIRRLLKRASDITGAAARIVRRNAGYVLEVDPTLVDLHRFTQLVERGTDEDDADRALLLEEALDLWRGTPLAGIPGDWVAYVRDSWHRRRLDAVVQWSELELRLGHPQSVLAAMPDLIAEYPLAEPLESLYMRALHGAGRPAEALDRYSALRRRLADELGTDPAPELQALHGALLRGEPPPSRQGPLPAQLPSDVDGFVGRDEELKMLDGRTSRVIVISGTAGVGKTALTVHWAQRVRAGFPDGQLYVNLRGFDPTGSPVAPTEAVRGFLDAFEVPRQRIPADLAAQVGLYRSLLANRRVLVVLDNARDAEQVRPLLPGTSSCLVLITSRGMLAGLVAGGAHPITLDLLDESEARELLATRTGAERTAADPHAVAEIVRLCARLPLALAVVAARAATHPTFGLSALAAELRTATGLDEFAGADPSTDPRAVFSWSYLQLSSGAAKVFRLLGLHAGPDISARAAASLTGVPAVRPLLAELARAHLVEEHAPGRFSCHDLLRAYARERVLALDPDPERRAATVRMLSHYVHSADHADHMLDPRREEPSALTPVAPGTEPERVADHAEALAWFATEQRVLLTAIHQPAEFDAQVWELIRNMRRFLAHQGHWHEEATALTVAVAAAERLGDPAKQAYAHCYFGCARVWSGDYDQALIGLNRALDLYRAADDLVGQAYVEHYQAWALEQQERDSEALTHSQRAMELFERAGHSAGQAKALNALGWFHSRLGDHLAAVDFCERALALQTELSDHLAAGQTWHSLGYAHDHLGHHARAASCYQEAVDLFHGSGHLFNEAHALTSLGDAHEHAGDLVAARTAWRTAFEILDRLGHPDAGKGLRRTEV